MDWIAGNSLYKSSPYRVKFDSDMRQVGGFLWVLRCSPPVKLTTTIYLKSISVESGIKHHNPNPYSLVHIHITK